MVSRVAPAEPLLSVKATSRFDSAAKGLFDEDERAAVEYLVASNPEVGVLVRQGGGIRKVRVARKGEGKSGGYRVIYFYADRDHPVFLLDVFAKADTENLTAGELADLRAIVERIKRSW